MSPTCPTSRSCTGVPPARGSARRRAAGFAIAIVALALIVEIETWAIENVSTVVDYCSATLSSDLARVLGDVCSDSGAPVAIVH